MRKPSIICAAVVVACAGGFLTSPPVSAQVAPPVAAAEPGGEPGNWGLAPFSAVPSIALRPEDRAAIRALEDQHIKERRTFEDKYESELRQLIRKQAEEREALRMRLAPPR